VLDLPPGLDTPPAVVVDHDESASAGADDALTRSIRAQISAAYTAGALPESSQLEPADGGGVPQSGGPVIKPPVEH
jgi:hypothetical protein